LQNSGIITNITVIFASESPSIATNMKASFSTSPIEIVAKLANYRVRRMSQKQSILNFKSIMKYITINNPTFISTTEVFPLWNFPKLLTQLKVNKTVLAIA